MESVANADETLGEMFLEERTPSVAELKVISCIHTEGCGLWGPDLDNLCKKEGCGLWGPDFDILYTRRRLWVVGS